MANENGLRVHEEQAWSLQTLRDESRDDLQEHAKPVVTSFVDWSVTLQALKSSSCPLYSFVSPSATEHAVRHESLSFTPPVNLPFLKVAHPP